MVCLTKYKVILHCTQSLLFSTLWFDQPQQIKYFNQYKPLLKTGKLFVGDCSVPFTMTRRIQATCNVAGFVTSPMYQHWYWYCLIPSLNPRVTVNGNEGVI